MKSAYGDRLAGLFSIDLQPMLRKLGERRYGEPVPDDEAAVQAAVWAAVAEAGGLRAGMPGGLGAGLRTILPIAELMGESLYRSPYFDTLTAADAIGAFSEPDHRRELLEAAADGEIAIAIAAHDPRPLGLNPETGRITCVRRFVRCADTADLLLVAGGGPVLALVELGRPGVVLREHLDLGRGGLFEVHIQDVPPFVVEDRMDGRRWDTVLDRARLRHAAYLLGLCRASLELATAHARQRMIFGRSLGVYQAPAFRLAALAARLEAVRSLVYRACPDADRDPISFPASRLRVAAAQSLLLARELALDTTAETLQLHGASGLVEGSDAQLFYRRALTESVLFGTAAELRARLCPTP